MIKIHKNPVVIWPRRPGKATLAMALRRNPKDYPADDLGHRTYVGDASTWDEKCLLCGAQDNDPSRALERPCPKAINDDGTPLIRQNKKEPPMQLATALDRLFNGVSINEGPPLTVGLWFLATPYSNFENHDQAALLAAQQAALLFNRGVSIFSPIAHGHAIATAGRNYLTNPLPTDASAWEKLNNTILRECTGLIVGLFPGWHNSIGVKGEIQVALDLGKPIIPMLPGVMPQPGR